MKDYGIENARPIRTENDSIRRNEYTFLKSDCGYTRFLVEKQDYMKFNYSTCPKCKKRIIINYKEERFMELKVNEVTIPEKIEFNYEELKTEIAEKVKMYETLVYDDEQIKQAKQDKANLNKLKQAINQERIRREREYLEPFNEFKVKINEIIQIIDRPISIIDEQIKGFDEKRKDEKKEEIRKIFKEVNDIEWLKLQPIAETRWLNVSASVNSIKAEIEAKIAAIKCDLATIDSFEDYKFEALEKYKETLNLHQALSEAKGIHEMQRKKEEHEKQASERALEKVKSSLYGNPKVKAESEPEPEQKAKEPAPVVKKDDAKRSWIKFQANLTKEEALQLKNFFDVRDIEFKPVK